jgi:squalene-associated FAD-dependent desaturase
MTMHIVGGGLAGLAAALESTRRGQRVVLYEAAPELGGRARTYFSTTLDMQIDNGAHAVLRNNTAVQDYLGLCGTRQELTAYGAEGLTFYDVRTQQKARFAFPSALWSKSARPPGVSVLDLAAGLKLLTSNPQRTAADALRASPTAIEKLWEPLCTAALNTPVSEASATMLGTVVKQMAAPGGLRDGLYLPVQSLSAAYVAPAEKWLLQHGATIERGTPLRLIQVTAGRATALVFDRPVLLNAEDTVIMALPPWSPLMRVVGIDTSAFSYAPIVNAHFKLASPATPQFTGLTGGGGQWLWVRGNLASLTVSAADDLQVTGSDAVVQMLWAEIAPLLGQPTSQPRAHVIKERRATIRHTPGLARSRPGTGTKYANLFLAGDWVISDPERPLPCTLESAIRSGFAAAKRAADGIKHA